MNLHKEIVTLQPEPSKYGFKYSYETSYVCGFRDARHAAAELALKAEARIEELEEALCRAQEDINWMINSGQLLNVFVFDYIDEALKK